MIQYALHYVKQDRANSIFLINQNIVTLTEYRAVNMKRGSPTCLLLVVNVKNAQGFSYMSAVSNPKLAASSVITRTLCSTCALK